MVGMDPHAVVLAARLPGRGPTERAQSLLELGSPHVQIVQRLLYKRKRSSNAPSTTAPATSRSRSRCSLPSSCSHAVYDGRSSPASERHAGTPRTRGPAAARSHAARCAASPRCRGRPTRGSSTPRRSWTALRREAAVSSSSAGSTLPHCAPASPRWRPPPCATAPEPRHRAGRAQPAGAGTGQRGWASRRRPRPRHPISPCSTTSATRAWRSAVTAPGLGKGRSRERSRLGYWPQ